MITRVVRVGAHVSAGQPFAFYKRRGTCIEIGWSAAGGSTRAQMLRDAVAADKDTR